MVKKLTALLLCALFTGAAFAADDMVKEETKSSKRSNRYNRNKNNGENKAAATTVVTDEIVSPRHVHGRYEGRSCSNGSCGVKSCNTCNTGRRHSHACEDKSCGHCYRKEAMIPPKPCCEKAVTVYTQPCLHKQTEITYNWTCPVEYTEAACPTC